MTTAAKQRCNDALDVWRARFLADGQAAPILRERTALVDELVQQAYASTLAPAFPGGLSLMAVGGYGRRELFPNSDVDLLVLVRRTPQDPEPKEALSEFLRVLWDMGLRVSHSVRTPEECCQVIEGNLELTVSLLDERVLAGDKTLYAQWRERFGRFLKAERRDLTRRLCRMTRGRHSRFHNTIYRLEPDVKEAPGGLRDLQAVRWLQALRDHEADPDSDPRPRQFLFAARCFLHFRANRDQNLLNFESQDEIAASLFSPWQDPAEWMRAWFRNANAVFRAVLAELETSESQDRSLFANFRDWRARLSNADFTVARDLVFLRHPQRLDSSSTLPLELFEFVARHGVRPATDTARRITSHLFRFQQDFTRKPPGVAFWRTLLSLPHAPLAIRSMAETGFLGALLPEWTPIEHLVVRDFYHQYTVDEHTLVTLEVLRELPQSEASGAPGFAALLEESQNDSWLLRMALLLHDIGKGSGRDHSEESERIAAEFLGRMGMEDPARETVLFLIRHHLTLPAAIQSRDMDDPATAHRLKDLIRTTERLRALTLLSYADISAVNTAAMSPWRRDQLWRLYRIVHRALTGALTEDRVHTPETAWGEVTPDLRQFVEGLPARYLWTHSRERALEHLALYRKAAAGGASVEVERREGSFLVTIVASDRPFLFASLAGALSSFGVDIVQAEAFSNAQGVAIDLFAFTDPTRSLELNPPERERLRMTLRRVAAGELRAEDLLRQRTQRRTIVRRPAFTAQVGVDHEASAVATVVEVVAQDRPGLLHALASAISRAGCNIEVVLVDTEAHKAIDVFHLTREGRKLTESESHALRGLLLAACRPPDSD
ncbi:MAG TPA: [protein-PII] uridylyltransferase [Bryobacteraceae bacterium]|nr:[protein-PII] uridylyltransferase [Bryobacteraceae bacterium]